MNTRFLNAALLAVVLAGCSSETPPAAVIPEKTQQEQQAVADKMKQEVSRKADARLNEAKFAAQESAKRAAAAPVMARLPEGLLPPLPQPAPPVENRDQYAPIDENRVTAVKEQPVSTLSIDVDSGSYSVVRRHLNGGRLPPKDAVRVEEMINYFGYDYPLPESREHPIRAYTEIAATPWNPDSLLLHVGIQGYRPAKRPAANLVFLIDVSGSMNAPNKLPLLVSSFRLLVNQLTGEDRVSLVTYAGNSGVALEPTPGDQKERILSALDQLTAGGSTHGSAGIQQAYALAEQARIKDGINRVILATDGDFNVGLVSHEKLIELIEQKRAQGISLTTLGFGEGNYNDRLMEQLADKGNGNYGYIDTISEAQKLLVDELASTLETIAGDVKIQIEFNPAVVAEYRLIGYENRLLNREDFNNDKVDAGEMGAGHTVTALYEITLVGGKPRLEPLRYAESNLDAPAAKSGELAFLKLRYKLPGQEKSALIDQPIERKGVTAEPSERFRFAAAVGAFGQFLRGGKNTGNFRYEDVLSLAQGARGDDPYGYRSEFVRLVRLAASLK